MPRRSNRSSARRTDLPDARPANLCRAIVRSDGSRIRKKIKQDYDKALRDLDKSRQQLDQFQQTDQPQFSRWFNGRFGASLTELRELSQKIAADEAIIFAVQSEVMLGGGSYARAYKRVTELPENPEPPPAPPGGENAGEADSFRPQPEPENPYAEGDRFKSMFEEMFGSSGPGEDPREPFNPWGQPPAPVAPVQTSQRLKELYRAVVRRLHPDSQREMTAQKTEWWHQAQAAYEAGDADQLEVILTLCEIGENGSTAQTSVSLLQRITAQLKHSLRAIKRQIAQRRRDPAWGFSNRTDHTALAKQIEHDLTSDLTLLRHQWQGTQSMIAKWKAAAEQAKPSRRRQRKSTTPNPDFLF